MFIRLAFPIVLFLSLLGCGSETERAAASGDAFVGPMSLPLRTELSPKAPVAATAKHGDRVHILQRRRRFAKVRLRNGAEGWVDGRQLMRPDQIEELRELWKHAEDLPSMGAASVWDKLNIHTAPNRLAPSFDQIPEQGRVDVVWQTLVPRNAYQDPGIDIPKPKQPPKLKKTKEKKQPRIPPPPPPPAPRLPENWLELSKTRLPDDLAGDPEPEPPPVQLEDWTLVRTKDRKAGWVLTRALSLAIPDEVAQYAEGKRITSYLSLGEAAEGRHNWLWTTISGRLNEYQFDSFRVFIWNVRRNRYETAYIERNVKGYFPVEAQKVEVTEGKVTSKVPGFALLIEERDGQLFRKTYAFQGYRVRLVEKTPARRADPLADLLSRKTGQVPAAPPPPERGLFLRIQDKLGSWKNRLTGD